MTANDLKSELKNWKSSHGAQMQFACVAQELDDDDKKMLEHVLCMLVPDSSIN